MICTKHTSMAEDHLDFDSWLEDLHLSNLFGENEEDIDEELQFRETLICSMITAQMKNNGSLPSPTAVEASPAPDPEQVSPKKNDGGLSSQFFCEICADTKGIEQMFKNQTCDHSFCTECISGQVAAKIQEGRVVVPCPGLDCEGVIQVHACREILPEHLLDRWETALCEALFVADPKLYCPFKDCSAMLLIDSEGESAREAECPGCHRLFCAKCYVPWHPGVECEEFQKLNEDERGRDDLLVKELASEKKWARCPQCKYYVEKTEGCLHITCRCQFQFCYACGASWTPNHGGCQ